MQLLSIFFVVLVVLTRLPELFPALSHLYIGKIAFAFSVVSLFCIPKGHAFLVQKKVSFARFVFLLYFMAMLSVPFSVWGSEAVKNLLSFSKLLFLVISLTLVSTNCNIAKYRYALTFGFFLLAMSMIMSSSSSRVTVGASYDPNDIALLFVTFLPVFLGEAMQGRMLVRVLHVVLGLMVLLSLVLTGSRGAIVALGVQACYFVLTANRFRMLAIAMVLAGALIVAMNADDKLWERFKRLGGESEQSDYNFTDRSGRIEIWKNGLGMVANNPVLGVGVGLFSTALFLIDGKIALTAHNTYLQVAAELGIPGLICYLALLCGAWRVVCRHVEDDPPDGATRWMALKISIVGFAVGSFFISAAYSAVLYFLLALVASMHFVQTTRADRDAGFESTPLSEATGGLKPHGFKLRQKKVRQ